MKKLQLLQSRRSVMLEPLLEFYRWSGREYPVARCVQRRAIPEPYRGLLAHNQDMTSTLVQYWGESLHIQPLRVRDHQGFLFREVVLVTDGTERRVEFGAIKIHLQSFSDEALAEILECCTPLGSILNEFQIPYRSLPTSFFSIVNDDTMTQALGLSGSFTMYGRHNVLRQSDRLLAEVVEIVPNIACDENRSETSL